MRSVIAVLLAVLLPCCGCGKGGSQPPSGDAETTAAMSPGAPSAADAALPDVAPDPAWQEVLAAARSTLPPGDPALLEQALDRFAPFERDLRERLRDRRKYDDGTPFEPVPDAARQAIDDLCAWQRAGGGLDRTDCRSARVLETLTLARLALELSAGAPEHPALRAALYLAQRFREEGTTLLQVMLGAAIMLDAAERWKTLPPDARPVFAEYAPSDGFLVRAVAAEGVCAVRTAELILGPEGDDLRAKLAVEYGLPTPAEQAEFLGGELGDLRRYFTDLLHALREGGADPATAFARADALSETLHADPTVHPLASTIAAPLGKRLQELNDARDAYRAYLESGS